MTPSPFVLFSISKTEGIDAVNHKKKLYAFESSDLNSFIPKDVVHLYVVCRVVLIL